MNEPTLNEKTKDTVSELKLLGSLRPLVGALVGILLFYLLLLLLTSGKIPKLLWAPLFSPGVLALFLFDIEGNLSSLGSRIILFSLSGIPYAIIGSLLFCKKKAIRAIGGTLIVIYLCTSIVAGMFVLMIASINN